MVRWLILLAVGVAGAALAQAAAISNTDAGPGAAARPSSQVEVPGLRPPAGMRSSSRLREHLLSSDAISTFIQGDQMSGNPDTAFTLTGNAQIRRPDVVLKGDSIHYDRATGEVTVNGKLRMLRDATLITGPSGHINLDDY